MMNHATFKASLFMAAGIIDHETGTRDIRRLSGLYRFMPITATLAMVAAAAMAGVPLLNGFLSKEMFFAETIATHITARCSTTRCPTSRPLASMFSVAYSLRFIHGVFFGPPPTVCRGRRTSRRLDALSDRASGPASVSSSASCRRLTIGPFLHIAVALGAGRPAPAYSLAVWHGFTLPLLMSMIALAGGVATLPVLRSA